MSNPISDTAHFFAERRARSTTHRAHRSHDEQDHVHVASSGLASPSLNDHTQPARPSRTWSNVLSRMSILRHNTPVDHTPMLSSPIQDEGDENLSTIGLAEESRLSEDSERAELVQSTRRPLAVLDYGDSLKKQSRGRSQDPAKDERLPSAYDLREASQDDECNTDFFAKPFSGPEHSSTRPSPLSRIHLTPYHSPEPPASSPSPEATPEVHQHWTSALDKIRTVTRWHGPVSDHLNAEQQLNPLHFTDPVFISLSSDENGHRPPRISLSYLFIDVTDSEFLPSVNQWAFRIELQYGDVKWVLRRTIADFVTLHYTLWVKSSLSDLVPAPPTFPNQLSSLLQSAKTTIGLDREEDLDEENPNEDATSAIQERNASLDRRQALTQYLQELLLRMHQHVSHDLCEFLELSATSLTSGMGWKGKEGFLKHRVKLVNTHCCTSISPTHLWATKWVMLRDSYIAFCENIASNTPSDVFLLDKGFSVAVSEPNLFGKYHITFSNHFHHIHIKGIKRELDEWLESVQKVQMNSPWVKNHRFGSFAPIRHASKIKWFVDAENHFSAVADAILSAKEEIYIEGWWLTPELYLKRPPSENEEFRIDRLLQRKAQEGVMVYIVVYKEMSVALTINSAHTKKWLQNLHPNIIVQRHRDIGYMDNVFWSHHEKIVVVDNRLAFIGGLDLCFGRYDTHEHSLSDCPHNHGDPIIFPGQDYSNPRSKDFVNVEDYNTTLIDRKVVPRMPWHDVTVGVAGPIARDIARHFIQRWNFIKATKSMHRHNVHFLMPKGEYVAARDETQFKGTCRAQLLRSSTQWSSGVEREHSIYNAYMECITQAKHFIYIENQFFISATEEDRLIHNKIAQAIVERIKRAHKEGEKFRVVVVIPLVPAFEGDLASSDASFARTVMHYQYASISRGGRSIMDKLKKEGIEPSDYIGWYSLRNWGRIVPESSRSDENNHRTTSPANDSPSTHDTSTGTPESSNSTNTNHDTETNSNEKDDPSYYVSELLYIHDKIMIVDDQIALIGSANLNDRSQLGDRDSEIAMLIEDTFKVPSIMNGREYMAARFAHTLRIQLWKEHLGLLDVTNWDDIYRDLNRHKNASCDENSPQIVDHLQVKLHRDRSVGNPLSRPNAPGDYDEPVRVLDRLSRSLSQYDMAFSSVLHHDHDHDHAEASSLDPLTDACFHGLWTKTAESNTAIYRDIFRCVPDDTIHTFEQHRQFTPDASKVPAGHVADPYLSASEVSEQLSKVQGHLVQFPTNYLCDENILSSNLLDSVTPMIIFT